MYNYIFFTNVLRLLDERHMTKKELSDRSGVSISFLSDLTTGKANPSLKVMEDIAQALETPLPLLLESTDLDKEALDALAGGNTPKPAARLRARGGRAARTPGVHRQEVGRSDKEET